MSPVFFTDRDLGTRFPELLRAANVRIERHCDHFRDDTRDDQWIPVLGRHGWYLLTHDKRIRYRPSERDAVMRAGLGCFILVSKGTFPELAESFIITIDLILAFVRATPRPFIAKIYRGNIRERRHGEVKLDLSYSAWRGERGR